MKNQLNRLDDLKKQIGKNQLLSTLAKKNLKGGGDTGCPPPIGSLSR